MCFSAFGHHGRQYHHCLVIIIKNQHPTRSDPLQIVLTSACLLGSGACADFTLTSAALIKTNPTEW